MRTTESLWLPDESWNSRQIEAWLKTATRWHLLRKQYRVQNGLGDWYYQTTPLGLVVLGLLKIVIGARKLAKYPDTGESGDAYNAETDDFA